MNGFNFTTFCSIASDIARRHKHDKPHHRINSFVVISKEADLESPMFNKTDRDKEIGHYWSRYEKVVDKPRDIVLFCFQETAEYEHGGKKCLNLILGVAQEPKCIGCPENVEKTPDEVDIENEEILWGIYKELCRYTQYKNVNFKDGTIKDILATPEQMKCWKDEGEVLKCTDCGVTIKHNMPDHKKPLSMFTNCIADRRIKSINFKVCGCSNTQQDFEVKPVETEQIATVDCASCFG